MIVWTSFFLILHITIISSNKFHEKSLLKNIIHNELNKFQCDIHDMIVRNFMYQLNSIY
jgi:hypothetical protein